MRKISLAQTLTTLLLGVSVLNLSSCGGGGGSGGKNPPIQNEVAVDAKPDGQYMAVLQTMNQNVAGYVTGSVTLSIEGKDFLADVRFAGLHPSIIHSQYVHEGTSCPSNDENSDGFIDAVESAKSSGGILIPLDGDLSSQDRGSSTFPLADTVGYYTYSEATSYDRFIGDLQEEDNDPEDDFVKIADKKNINLEGRVVIIYGVAPETVLPETVARRGRLANFQTLPVACGVFQKVTTVPGTLDDDSSVGPVPGNGETVGGGNGEDDGATVIIGGETGGGEPGPMPTPSPTPTPAPGPWEENPPMPEPEEEEEEDDGGIVGGWRWPWPRSHEMVGNGEQTL